MTRTIVALAACLLGAAPAFAQVHDGIDNSPSEQAIADAFRASGSKSDAPACRNDPDGTYAPPSQAGVGAKTPSISAGQKQPRN